MNMEYTQEQYDKAIADAKAEAVNGLYTKDDLEKEVQKESDRRVESGIKKGLETQKAKWQDEYDRKNKLSAEELAKEQVAEQMKVLEDKQKELGLKENRLGAISKLAKANVPEAYYSKLIDNLINPDAGLTDANVDNLIDVYTSAKSSIEAEVKAKLAKVTPPDDQNNNNGAVNKESFKTMGYAEKVALKQKDPELYKQLIK